jgi:hypothetical protein
VPERRKCENSPGRADSSGTGPYSHCSPAHSGMPRTGSRSSCAWPKVRIFTFSVSEKTVSHTMRWSFWPVLDRKERTT